MNNCLVSIVTPAYNCKNTIDKTYKSIVNQTFSDWEWIIVEDHSTDGSFDFINSIIKNDNRVVLLRTNNNSGAAVARNLGIEKAKGKYIAFLDADDSWKNNKLEKQIAFMENNKYYFTFTNYDVLLPNGTVKKRRIKKQKITYKDLLNRNYIGCLTVVYDCIVLGKQYMPIDCEKREDHGAWLDITRKGVIAYRLDDYLSTYNATNQSVSSNKVKMIKYQYRIYRKHEGFGIIKSMWYLAICCINKVFTW